MTALRRVLGYTISVEALLELALWLAIPHLVVGLVFTFFDPVAMQAMESQLQPHLPAGADLVAFGLSTALWPVLMLAPYLCP